MNTTLINNTTNVIIDNTTTIATNIFIAVLIVLIGFMVGKLVSVILNKIFLEIQLDKAVLRATNQNFGLSKFISGFIATTIYIISFFLALDHLEITGALLISILILVAIILLVSIFLAMTGFIPNTYARIMIYTSGKYVVGDKIYADTALGIIEKINWFSTKIKTSEGDTIYITNTLLWNKGKKVK